MNEEAFKHAYELFVKDGYNGTIDNFRALILSNNEALNHSYKLFERDGYRDGQESFKSLIGMPSQATQDRIAKSITPATQEPPVEKKSPSVTTESPSAPSSSVSFTGVDPFNLKQSMKPVSESTRVPRMEELKTVAPAPISEEKTKLKRGELPKVKKSLDVITPQLMSGTEEKASSVMNYHFGDLGFKFEETGATGDWIIATAPNGVKSEFSIDNFTSNKDEEESKRLRNFILKNSAEGTLGQVEKSRVGEMSKFYSDKEAQDAIKKINEETQSLIKERDNAIAEYNSGEKLAAYLDSIPVNQRDASWNEKYESAKKQKDLALGVMQGLEEKRNSVAQRTAQIETSVGSYYTMKEEQGTPYGWVWDQFTEAFGKAGAGMQNLKLEVAKKIPYFGDLMVTMNYGGDKDKNNEYKKDFIQIAKEKGIQVPKDVEDGTASFSDWKNSIAFGDVRRDEIDNQIKNKVLGEARKGVSETVIEGYKAVGDPNTSVEYSNLAKENFWVGAIAGLIDFAPAMIGTPINKAATMFAISNETMQQEFDNNPNFKDVSEADRFYYALPFNIANSVLLEFGLNRVMGNKSFVANLVTSAVSRAGSKATAYELKKIMQGEIQSALAKGTISLSKGVLSGAELGTTIYATDVAIRKTINEMKDKEMLETPESAKEFFIGAAQSAASLAVGAGIMSIHPSVKAAYAERGYKGMSDNTFLLFELASKSDVTQSALVTELKNKLASGDITMEEAKTTLNSYRNSVGLLKSLPENLSLEQKKQAMDLLKEKRDVERLVEGKDPALFKKQIDRIKEINESLSKISEDAVQKQKSDEALLRAGEEKLGLQQVGEGDTQLEVTPKQEEIVTPEGTEEVTTAEPTTEVTTAEPLKDIESTANALSNINFDDVLKVYEKVPSNYVDMEDSATNIVAEAYHKAKSEGSNPELVKAVEDLLGATPEVKTAEPTPEAKTALQQATEARKAAKAALDSLRKGMGISPQGRLEALVDYHRALVKEAKEFIKEKVDDINEWAKSIGENVNVALRKAWDEAKGTIKEVQTGDELGYDLQDIFGEEISKLPGYEETMRSVQDYADFSTRNKEYWQKQVEQAKKSGNKQREAEAKAELAKYTEGNINEAMRILEESELYKSASDVQREDLVRDVRSRFELKEKKAPSPEELFGDVADVNKLMEELNFLFDDANKSKDYLDEQYRKAKEAFDKNPTSEKLKENLDKAKAEVEEYKTKNIDEAIAKLKEKDLYKKATPDQQARMEKYLTDKFLKSQTEKILPTKLFGGAKDIKKVTITEKKRWKDQFAAYLRGQKDTATATKIIMKEVANAIDNLTKRGEITAKQAAVIIKKMSTLKIFDTKAVDKFVDYVSKVFADAEYNDKLNTANELRGSISKLASAKGKDANLVKMAKEFKKIKPSMVEDIDAYNQMAAKIKESLRGSRTGGKDQPLNVADMVKIADVAEYTKTQLEAQEKALYEQKLAEVNELLDTDLTGATLQELIDLVKSGKTIDENQETIIRDAIKKMFDINSTIIRSIIEKGEDPFTGEKIDVKESSKDLVKRFMGMDLNQMSIKEAIAAMDSLSNFLQNGSIANMKSVVESYQGKANAKRLVKEGLVAKQLRFYRIPSLGRYLGQQISTLPNLIETMFKGFTASSKFEKLSGITDLKNEKTFVQTKVNSLINEYVNKFYKEKPNGKDFEDVSNIIERAILADLRRTIQGTPEEQQAEFNRNKKLLKQSIEELKTGTEKEVELSKMYEEVYNKLDAENAKDINDIISKTDRLNIEANDWMVEKWADIYDDLADVSESVYNKILERDLFYTPKRMSSLFNRGEAKTEAQLDESLFHKNNGTVYKKKTGVLEEINRDMDKLPINETTKRATRFVDLSFDKNNFNAMYDALMDIHTAGTIRKIESFFKSPEVEKIIPNPEDRAILYNSDNTGRVQDFIRAARNKEMVVSDETAKLVRKLNTISSIGTATALGSFMQPFKQVIPVAANTLINTRGKLDFNYFGDKNDFMNRIGYGISVRGIESQAQVSSINKLVDLASKSKGAKALEYIEKANRIYLDAFLKNPDVYIAKASWMSYYEKALKKQNIDPKTIDYKTHKVNKEAADYAQKMVDRQQNISDTDLQGKLLGTKDQAKRFAISAVMPFASFRLNQFMRAKSDLATVFSLTSSTQDRKIAASSLVGYGTEMAVFKGMATMIGLGFGSLTNYLMGKDETDEEYQKRKENLYRAQATGTVTDVFSPIPMLDYFYAKGADVGLDIAQGMMNIEDDEKFKLMTNYKTDILKSLGTIGIAGQKAKTVYDAISLGATGEFEDEYGRTRYVSQNDREALKLVGGVSALAAFGLFPFPSDVNTISRNAVKSAKRTASNKEGGQTEEDIMVEREMKQESEISKQETQEERELKASVLNEMMKSEYDENKIDIISRKIREYLMTEEERTQYNLKMKNQRFYEKKRLKQLLGKYDSQSDMKKYDPILYEKTFGENSAWYLENKDEEEVDRELNKKLTEMEDAEFDYYKPSKGEKSGIGSSIGGQKIGSSIGGSKIGEK